MKNQEKKVILFVNYNAYPCVIGGLEVFNLHLIKHLSLSNSIEVLTCCTTQVYDQENVKSHIIKASKIKHLIIPLKTFFFVYRNRKRIKTLHLSYAYGYWSNYYIFVLIKKILRINYMVTIHDGNLSTWKPLWPFQQYFKHAKVITGVSQRIVDEYALRTKRTDIVFIPPLVPFNIHLPKNDFRSKWGIANDEMVLLYVGTLKPLKSVETLIEALGLMTKAQLDLFRLKVLIAGDGVSKESLEQQAENLGVANNINFLGNIKTEDIGQLYNIADIYTICSEYEGLPISTLEAFANSLPCVTSNAPGLHNISENNANTMMFETKNAAQYCERLIDVFSDEKLRSQLSENGNNYYQNLFSYPLLIEKFNKLIALI